MASSKMHKRSKSSQMQGMEEGGLLRSSSSDLGGEISSGSNNATSSDSLNMALLIMLYAMQGVPLGLSLGSVPFILKSQASYTSVGVFSLAGYPYSMKLLWSPIVDSVFSSRLGWRKSWVLPMQMASGSLMILTAQTADHWMETANIHSITLLFFVFILLAATQDIAVDGWALTLLSRKNVGHASTCQSVGINSGYFMSFTIFLALNDPAFCNNYLRSTPSTKGILTLSRYFYFWGWFYLASTILLLYKSEKPFSMTQSSGHSAVNASNDSRHEKSEPQRPDFYRSPGGDEKRHGKGMVENNGWSPQNPVDSKSGYSGRKERTGSGYGSHDDRLVVGTSQQMGVKRMYRRLWAVASLPSILSAFVRFN